jgi:CRISPR/Cas system CSM-associated protein Csm3 (group 7 of RAMP superfamily)
MNHFDLQAHFYLLFLAEQDQLFATARQCKIEADTNKRKKLDSDLVKLLQDRVAQISQRHWLGSAVELQALDRNSTVDGLAENWKATWRERRGSLEINVPQADIDLAGLPSGSWKLEVAFRLDKPLFTRNSSSFDVLDNPFRRDPVHGAPEFAGSSWKGALRSAFLLEFGDFGPRAIRLTDPHKTIDRRLFGSPKGRGQKNLRQGRLSLFPTRFSRIGYRLINPIKRKPAQAQPILYEVVPPKAEASLQMLYVPFDSFLQSDAGQCKREAQADATALAQAVRTMMRTGFGGKTSQGYGQSTILRHDFQGIDLDETVSKHVHQALHSPENGQ